MKLRIQIKQDVKDFMQRHNVTPTTLGIKALGNSHLVFQILKGTDLKISSVEKLYEYMEKQDAKSL